MKKTITCITSILIYTLAASINLAQAQEQSKAANTNSRNEASISQFQFTNLLAQARAHRRAAFALMPATRNAGAGSSLFSITPMVLVANPPVFGSGTAGKLTKWTGFTSNSSVIGDSNIYEDKFGKVGIGTTAPTSLFTVQGVIETFGGIKFGDGTLQTTSAAGALFGVAHDSTLQGNGTAASPLAVAVPLNLTGSGSGAVFSAANSGNGDGVSGSSSWNLGVGVRGVNHNGVGVFGQSFTDRGVLGESRDDVGVYGKSDQSVGVTGQSLFDDGVKGFSVEGIGVRGISINGPGVRGEGGTDSSGVGVFGVMAAGGDGTGGRGGDGLDARGGRGTNAKGGDGVVGVGAESTSGFGGSGVVAAGGSATGVAQIGGAGIVAIRGLGVNGATNGLAGSFNGNVAVVGTFSATGAKMFKIDHPLDPENKYLNHAAIESSEVLNIYSGNITTDQNGEATIALPKWFEALNTDFRYQLTVIGTFAQAIVSEEIAGNRFGIKTSVPSVRVSWQLTGVRSDAGMKKHPFEAEEQKTERERGHYLTPEVFNQPEEKSIEWARNPEMMQKLKQQRHEAEEKIKKEQQR